MEIDVLLYIAKFQTSYTIDSLPSLYIESYQGDHINFLDYLSRLGLKMVNLDIVHLIFQKCNQLVNQKEENQLEEMRKLSDKVEENNSSIEDCKAQVKVIEEMQLVQFFFLLVIMFLLILGLFPF